MLPEVRYILLDLFYIGMSSVGGSEGVEEETFLTSGFNILRSR